MAAKTLAGMERAPAERLPVGFRNKLDIGQNNLSGENQGTKTDSKRNRVKGKKKSRFSIEATFVSSKNLLFRTME